MTRYLFILLVVVSAFVSPALALFGGVVFALLFENPFGKASKKVSKYLLQAAVIGLGFGLNLNKAIETGREGLLFTIISVSGVMLLGYLLGRCFKTPSRLSYLISSGTAICGGSAIAAISPIVKADNNETSISLIVIFTLNAVALFVFPPIGHALGLTQHQFGLWAAIAIHDTSSVVGAGATYGSEALNVATTVKLTRALWIIPLSLVSLLFFKSDNRRISFPWFILLYVLAMVISTYIPLPVTLLKAISIASHKSLSVTLFLIGSTLTISAVKTAGIKPVLFGLSLWLIILFTSLFTIIYLWK